MTDFIISLQVADDSFQELDTKAHKNSAGHVTGSMVLQNAISRAVEDTGVSVGYLSMKMLATVKRDDPELRINCEALAEHIPIKGNALASGDDELDRRTEQLIQEQLEAGNIWAWCTVEVSVEWNGIESEEEYLGCCSYKSRSDFAENSGYYEDMVSTCLDNLNKKLADLRRKSLEV